MFNQILRPLARRAIQRGTQNRLSHHDHGHKMVTLDDAPIPMGSWKENFEKQQKKFNMQLIIGVTTLVATCVTVLKYELVYFNWLPPKPKDA